MSSRVRPVARWLCALGALAVEAPDMALTQSGTGTITGKVVDRDTGRGLDFANVVILGTTFGAHTVNGATFNLSSVPAGTYEVRASFVGYEPQQIADVRVDEGQTTPLDFHLKKGTCCAVQTIVVDGCGRNRVVGGSCGQNRVAIARRVQVKRVAPTNTATEDSITVDGGRRELARSRARPD